jgi:hypothetical protein
MGEVRDRALAIAMLVESFGVKGADFTPVRVRAYEDGLKDIAVPLLNAAVRRAIQTRTFFPKVAELRQDAEACRRELLAANVYQPCAQCNETSWEKITVDGVVRVTRCGCWKRHQERLAGLGVGVEPLALPPARDYVEAE